MDWPEELIKIPWKLILDNKGKKNNRCDTPTVRLFGHNARIIDIGKSSVSGSNAALH